jgi:hypothetical protein
MGKDLMGHIRDHVRKSKLPLHRALARTLGLIPTWRQDKILAKLPVHDQSEVRSFMKKNPIDTLYLAAPADQRRHLRERYQRRGSP